jgi:hypothetical protein
MKDACRRIEGVVEDRRGQISARRDLNRASVRTPKRRQFGAWRRQLGDRTAAPRHNDPPDPPGFEILEDRQASRLERGGAHLQDVMHPHVAKVVNSD